MKQRRKRCSKITLSFQQHKSPESPLGTGPVEVGDLVFFFLWPVVGAVLCLESETRRLACSVISLGTRERGKEARRAREREIGWRSWRRGEGGRMKKQLGGYRSRPRPSGRAALKKTRASAPAGIPLPPHLSYRPPVQPFRS